jgi:hypothetical protein
VPNIGAFMTDKPEAAKAPAAKAVKDKAGDKDRSNARWAAAGAAMGIGSAALVAALLYTNRDKKDAKSTPKPPPGHAPESD